MNAIEELKNCRMKMSYSAEDEIISSANDTTLNLVQAIQHFPLNTYMKCKQLASFDHLVFTKSSALNAF